MIERINFQGKPFEAVLLDLEEGKSSLILVDKEKDETTIIYMDTAQVTVRGLNAGEGIAWDAKSANGGASPTGSI